MKTRVPLFALLALGGLYACGPGEKAIKPAPETEIVLLYSADDKGEYEECG